MKSSGGNEIQTYPMFNRLLCLSFWWTWIWLLFFPGNPLIIPAIDILHWWSAGLLGSSLACLTLHFLPSVRMLSTQPRFSVICNVLCTLCTVVLSILQGANLALAVFLAFVSCFLSTFWAARAIRLIALPDVRAVVAQIACALFLGSVLYLLISDRPFAIEAFLIMLLPLFSLAIDIVSSKESFETKPCDISNDESLGRTDAPDVSNAAMAFACAPKKTNPQRCILAATLFACAATFGVFGGIVTDAESFTTDRTMMFGISFISFLVWIVALFKPQVINRFTVYYSTMPCYVLGMVFLIAAIVYAGELETVSVCFVIIGWACSLIFGWSFFVVQKGVVFDDRAPSTCILLIQLGTLCGTLLMMVGTVFGLDDKHQLFIPLAIIIGLVFMLVVIIFNLLRTIATIDAASTASLGVSTRNIESTVTPTPSDTLAIEGCDKRSMTVHDSIAAHIALDHGLSERESEILEPLIKGYSLPRIADELGVAKSTVATHAQHIYRKIGVHSRQDLINLLDKDYR